MKAGKNEEFHRLLHGERPRSVDCVDFHVYQVSAEIALLAGGEQTK
jgi:hypothetical protein